RGEAVDARHPDVEEDQVEGLRLEGPQRAVAVLDGHHVVAGLSQALLQHPAEAVLVVGDQQARSYRGDGRVTVRWARSTSRACRGPRRCPPESRRGAPRGFGGRWQARARGPCLWS